MQLGMDNKALEFDQTWGHQNDQKLRKAARDLDLLAFRIRNLLWRRLQRKHQHN